MLKFYIKIKSFTPITNETFVKYVKKKALGYIVIDSQVN